MASESLEVLGFFPKRGLPDTVVPFRKNGRFNVGPGFSTTHCCYDVSTLGFGNVAIVTIFPF